jgi:esterase/lipase
MPTLIIHGEEDSLVPLTEAEAIYSLLKTEEKKLVIIPYADHNSLIFEGEEEYFSAIATFLKY